MKDEEMAEEYTKNLLKKLGIKEDMLLENQPKYLRQESMNFVALDVENVTDAFLAGLKAGRPQWHDLRKDPNDLPKEPTEKMRVNETWAYVKFFDNTYGLVDKRALKNYKGAIAWCEIPTFDKE